MIVIGYHEPCKEGLRKPNSSIRYQNLAGKDIWDRDGKGGERSIRSIFNDPMNINDILEIYIPHNKTEDNKVWSFTKSKQLSIKTAYKILSS